MRKLRFLALPLFIFCTLFTSCIDIIENMVLNKDGTGNYSITMDMGKMMHDPFMKGMMEASEENKMEDKDSIFFMNSLPDSVIGDNKEFWSRVSMRVVSNEKNEDFYITINLDYKHVDEIAYLAKNLDRVMAATKSNPMGSEENGSGPSPGFLSETLKFTLAGKELVRTSDDSELLKGEQSDDLEMMKSFMGSAEYKVFYQLPAKVKNTSIPSAKVEKNKVSVVVPLMDVMENKVSLNGSIKY
jgi:hypothetical protein